jgi:hypothetical protein
LFIRVYVREGPAVKVLVCGGRNIGRTSPNASHQNAKTEIQRATHERTFVFDYLSTLHKEKSFTEIIGGDEGGAERLGMHWAVVNKVPQRLYARTSKRETIIGRNKRMLAGSNPDLIIAFGSGVSTEILIGDAKEKGIQVIEVAIPDLE